jgi:hypothetical protein
MHRFLSDTAFLMTMLLLSATTFSATKASDTSKQTLTPQPGTVSQGRIDRHALVNRHNVKLNEYKGHSALQVGNGEFAFTADLTGLQTFDGNLGTYSQWGWHTSPNPEKYRHSEAESELEVYGRKARYSDPNYESLQKGKWTTGPSGIVIKNKQVKKITARQNGAYWWYRHNPHRLHLGMIGFQMTKDKGGKVTWADLSKTSQQLNLWKGMLISSFELEGQPVEVLTCCHPRDDSLAVKVKSPLLATGKLKIIWRFPYMSAGKPDFGDKRTQAHSTTTLKEGPQELTLKRALDQDEYYVTIRHSDAKAKMTNPQPHHYLLTLSKKTTELSFVTLFSKKLRTKEVDDFAGTVAKAEAWWRDFWLKGGAVDLSGSKDPRWRELERRIVLSQYLTAIQCAGSAPPQETGLFNNTYWYGKFHLEMTAWHGVHFALWGREHLLERWMKWIRTTGLKAARRKAKYQGYRGARWHKMIDAAASWESPSRCGPFRLTQQGHMIYLPELMYRLKPTRETLNKYKDVVFESAEFMVDFLHWDKKTRRYVLGPPLISGAECNDFPLGAQNSTVELSYWAYGLETAQQWRKRLGMSEKEEWNKVLEKLAAPPIKNGVYRNVETGKHGGRPAWFEAYGCMPGTRIDHKVMEATFEEHTRNLSTRHCWGCDFPMLAMTAARLGKPAKALELLMYKTKVNSYLANGSNPGGAFPYYPGNGGLLWAVSMMAAGWEGCPDRNAPGFPDNGQWDVKWERMRKAP